MGIDVLYRGFLRRFENHVAKSREYEVRPPVLSEWWSRVLEAYRSGFRCEYCGRPLKLEGSPDDPDLWTIDHKIPLKLGGDNGAGNIAIVCNRCNRAKASLPAGLYLKLLDAVRKAHGEEVLEQILYYLSIPGKAKKVEAWSSRANRDQ